MKKSLLLFLITLLWAGAASAQNGALSGVVKNAAGQPVLRATVGIKGTNNYTSADNDGKFTLVVRQDPPFTLRISAVGYTTQEVAVKQLSGDVSISLADDKALSEVVVTSRRRSEVLQDVPIPVSVISGRLAAESGAFNVNRIKELIPTVQLYASNARNTTLNIRGLGSTFGLTNDGVDPGVGFYIDGVYNARPAATALDFIDVERVEVLRGPQGTLFGKNTTAGAFNITTKAPSFTPDANFEVSSGNIGYIQAKASITGPLLKNVAGRLSFSGTQRDGTVYSVRDDRKINGINNWGIRGSLLFTPTENVKITLAGDATRQRPNGYATVLAGVVTTQRKPFRQFLNIVSDISKKNNDPNYTPNLNAFDRTTDSNTPWRSDNNLGGVSLNADIKLGKGTLTSTTAWRYWDWNPSNDRDFTKFSVLTKSQADSRHDQFTQEIRYSADLSKKLSGVIGAFFIGQRVKSAPVQTEESGVDQARFSRDKDDAASVALWDTPGLFEGYGIKTVSNLKSTGIAVFGQLDYAITDKLHILPGARYNYDKKDVTYARTTYGGLIGGGAKLDSIKKLVYSNQAFALKVDESNVSGQFTVAYKVNERFNTFATVSTSFKPVGVNVGGLPTDKGRVLIELGRVKPEYTTHYELGFKTKPSYNSILNLTFHDTEVKDYQTTVQTAEVGVNRGYLANAEKVRVQGIELEGNVRFKNVQFYGGAAYTDAKYVKFKNAPVPLEETGGANAFKDISGGRLPGVSKWVGNLGGEYNTNQSSLLGQSGNFFLAVEGYARTGFSSSPSPSKYLNIAGYALLNARAGFKAVDGVSVFLWSRNLLNKDYYEQLLPAAGNAGQYSAVLGDPRTYGITFRYSL